MGGAERALVEQALCLEELGIHCSIIVSELADSFRIQLPSSVDVYVLGRGRYSDLMFFPRCLKVGRLLRKLRPDCVIAHQSLHDDLYLATRGTGIPYFLLRYESRFYSNDQTIYSHLFRHAFRQVWESLPAYRESIPTRWSGGSIRRLMNEYLALRDWLGVRGASCVFVLTSRSKWELKQLYGIEAFVWTPGLNYANHSGPVDRTAIQRLRAQHDIELDEKVVLSVNRLDIRKRIHFLIEAFRLLLTKGGRAKLILVGEGEQREALEYQVKVNGMENVVKFAGSVSDEMLPSYYHMCDVAVAIMWGSWALSIVEPLLYNKNVLISDELPDLLDSIPNLYRVKPKPIPVSAGLEQALLQHPQNSYKVISTQLDWQSQMGKLLDVISAER